MHDAEERTGKVALVVAGGQPAIVRAHLGAEGMHGGVDAPGLEIEAHAFRHAAIEPLLGGDGIATFELFRIGTGGGLAQAGQQGRQPRLQVVEERRELRHARAGFVGVQQRVVTLILVPPAVGLLTDKPQDFFQPRREGGEVRCGAGLGPVLAREGRGLGQVLDQAAGQFGGAIIVAAPLADVGAPQVAFEIVGAGGHFILTGLEPVTDFRGGSKAMRQACELRELPGSEGPGLFRHVRFLIPGQDASGAVVAGNLAGTLEEQVVGVHDSRMALGGGTRKVERRLAALSEQPLN